MKDVAYQTSVDASDITPRHDVRDHEKLAALVSSMEASGWIGRPLLLFAINSTLFGMTGSHRSAAALKTGTPVPALVVPSVDLGAALAGYDIDAIRPLSKISESAALLLVCELLNNRPFPPPVRENAAAWIRRRDSMPPCPKSCIGGVPCHLHIIVAEEVDNTRPRDADLKQWLRGVLARCGQTSPTV